MSEPTNPCPDPAEPSGDRSHTWNLGPVVPPNEQAQRRARIDAAVCRETRQRHLVGLECLSSITLECLSSLSQCFKNYIFDPHSPAGRLQIIITLFCEQVEEQLFAEPKYTNPNTQNKLRVVE